jgi:hypothetical protein
MPQVEFTELYCRSCSRVQPVTRSGKTYTCSVCQGRVEPVTNPDVCPKAPSGRHNAFRDVTYATGWCCSQCLVPMAPPADADVVQLGRFTR